MLIIFGISLLLLIHGTTSEGPDGNDGAQSRDIFTMAFTPGQGNVFHVDETTPATSQMTTFDKTTQSSTSMKPTTTQMTSMSPTTRTFQNPSDFGKSYVSAFQKQLRLFAGELYHQVLKMTPKDQNIFFSPSSISHSLAVINAGAGGNSSLQIRKAMKLDGSSNDEINAMFKVIMDDKFSTKTKSDVIAKMAARSFIQKSFSIKKDYIDSLMLYYNSGVESMDFSKYKLAQERINTWVEDNTNKLIKDLIPDGVITPLTRLVLVNTLYFKAPWTSRFTEMKLTEFQTPSGPVKVPYLYQKASFKVLDKGNTLYVGVPYNDKKTYCIIAMPKNDQASKRLEEKLNIKRYFRNLRQRLKEWKTQKVTLFIPKFTVEQSLNLINVLKGMELTDIFSQTNADLSGVSDTYLYVSDFLHKARITVNKDGTEAAAASASLMAARSLTKSVFIDRPFMLTVFEDDGDILFTGKIVNPSA